MQILIEDSALEPEELKSSLLAISVILGMYGLKGYSVPEKEVNPHYRFKLYGQDGFRPEPEFRKFIRLRVSGPSNLNSHLEDLAEDLKGVEGFRGLLLSPYEAERRGCDG